MGKFADSITGEADWEKHWTPKDLENHWIAYVNGTLADAAEALLGAPEDSKERVLYGNAVAKVQSAALAGTRRYDRQGQTDQAKEAVAQELLRGFDHYASLIESHGLLYLRSLECERIFRGDWTPEVGTTVPAAHAKSCNTYNFKHFGGDRGAAWYLGPFDRNYKAVKALEEKAIESGLDVPGAYIFRFNAALGWDGENDARGTINTNSLRVDSVGSLQHSHPIPETGTDCVSHQKLVCTAICEAVEKKELERLVAIAKYLTTIGATAGEYKMPGQILRDRLKTALRLEGTTLPACKFWND